MAVESPVEIIETPVEVISVEDLEECLRAHDIDLSKWGVDGAKTVRHLLKEIQAGETHFRKGARGLVRQIMPSGTRVYHVPAYETGLYLKESHQISRKDGKRTERKRPYSVGEKAKPGETLRESAIRGIREELKIIGDFTILDREKSIREEDSPSFPGLLTRYIDQRFDAILNAEQYKPDGYVELGEGEGDKDTHFVWVPASTAQYPIEN